MSKIARMEKGAQKIKHWKNPLATNVESRRLYKNSLACDIIRVRRLARQFNKERDYEGLEEIGEYLGQSLHIYEEYFTDHEFAQLIGANFKQVEKLRWGYDVDGYETPFFIMLILSDLEQDHEKPLAEAIAKTVNKELNESPALKERALDALEELRPEIRGRFYKIVEDKDGNQIREKYYRPLKLVKRL